MRSRGDWPSWVLCRMFDHRAQIRLLERPDMRQWRLIRQSTQLGQSPLDLIGRLPHVRSLEEPDLSAVVKHLCETHATTLMRLKAKRERDIFTHVPLEYLV
jgi:tRNA U34 5-carboxymethylaminomethyl modifying enzyme MnmG/GidA